jgi:hypothetical protein
MSAQPRKPSETKQRRSARAAHSSLAAWPKLRPSPGPTCLRFRTGVQSPTQRPDQSALAAQAEAQPPTTREFAGAAGRQASHVAAPRPVPQRIVDRAVAAPRVLIARAGHEYATAAGPAETRVRVRVGRRLGSWGRSIVQVRSARSWRCLRARATARSAWASTASVSSRSATFAARRAWRYSRRISRRPLLGVGAWR